MTAEVKATIDHPAFGIVHVDSPLGMQVPDLVRAGLRRNPRRAHLLVSTVLGKHLPTAPSTIIGAGEALGDLVRAQIGSESVPVVGFAETATSLGHCVATRIGARVYVHSTRRHQPDPWARFEEAHSHATSHDLQPSDPALLGGDVPLVLVDDEISTGNTAIDAIRALNAVSPRDRYLVASLVDMRTEADDIRNAKAAEELGVSITWISLAQGRVDLPSTLTDSVAALPDPPLNLTASRPGTYSAIRLRWPADVPLGGQRGFAQEDGPAFDAAVAATATTLVAQLPPNRAIVLLGHEEFMYLPLRLAAELENRGVPVRFQTTTRSPAYVCTDAGYPLQSGFRFVAPESDPDAPRYLYNADWPENPDPPLIVAVVDPPADTAELYAPGGLVDVLTAAGRDVMVAVVTP